MTTKVEPTVEKWERDFDEKFGDPDAIAAKNAYGDDVYYKYHIEYMPDSLIKDFIRTLLSHSVQEARAERVAEIENSKIISSIGYRPSKFRGLSAVAIYNMALDDLLASLKQEEEHD